MKNSGVRLGKGDGMRCHPEGRHGESAGSSKTREPGSLASPGRAVDSLMSHRSWPPWIVEMLS